jgi:hypothetical protein
VTPVARVRNYSQQSETFSVTFRINSSPPYEQTRGKTLGQGLEDTVAFPAWAARPGYGIVARCSVYMAGDQNRVDDTLSGTGFDVYYRDVRPEAIDRPRDTVDYGTPVLPRATIRNAGNTAENFPVRLKIAGTTYDQTVTAHLGAGVTDTVAFPVWTADTGATSVRCSTLLSTDMDRSNDLVTVPLVVRFSDVQATAIIAPAGTVDSNAQVRPIATVTNNGTSQASFSARFRIEGESYDQVRTKTLAPRATDTVGFPVWTAQVRGSHTVVCSTAYTIDLIPGNDRITGLVDVLLHDVGTVAILAPTGRVNTKATVIPSATIRNHGNAVETFNVRFGISDGYFRIQSVTDLRPGEERVVSFEPWTPPVSGTFSTKCSTSLDGDACHDNDWCADSVLVGSDWPYGWREVAPAPMTPSGKPVKLGGWLAHMAGTRSIYVAKGNKTGDFYVYDPLADIWRTLAPIPDGKEGRPSSRGAAAVADGNGRVYAVKGNNTSGFWCYAAATDSWEQLPDVPLQPSKRKVRGGGDVQYVVVNDTGYVYLLKGSRNDFYRFNTVTRVWEAMASPCVGSNHRWQKGSWLAYDGDNKLYAHKARHHELLTYDIGANAWSPALLAGMPMQSRVTGRRKKSRDGGGAAWYSGALYALKGGNTQEFWKYLPTGDSWTELDTMPAFGSTGRKKKVWYGGDIAGFGEGAFFALKGNKTVECWRYVQGPVSLAGGQPLRDGVLSPNDGRREPVTPRITPNPAADGRVRIDFGPVQGRVVRIAVCDLSGRIVLTKTLPVVQGWSNLELGHLAAGTYLLRLGDGRAAGVHKLTVSE